MTKIVGISFLALCALMIAGCFSLSGESATIPVEETYGKRPVLPKPNPTLIPTLNIAPAAIWQPGAAPTVAPGLAVREFAGGVDHPLMPFNKRRQQMPNTIIQVGTAIPPDDINRKLTVASTDDPRIRHISVAGGVYTIVVTGEETGGRYCLIDMLVPSGGGPPPHRHDFEEMFTILEGGD